jgi:phosphoribosylamine--glycine ligase/phosphoribosylformylglycinamidine cyclo-ligase
MVIAVSKKNAPRVISILEAEKETVYTIGKLIPRTAHGCVLQNLRSWD